MALTKYFSCSPLKNENICKSIVLVYRPGLFWLITSFIFFFYPAFSWAVSANPRGVELSQPDGSKITIFMRGDEFYSWNEDSQGYTILKDTTTQTWVYVGLGSDGHFLHTQYRVGFDDPTTLNIPQHLMDKPRVDQARVLQKQRNSASSLPRKLGAPPPARTAITTGTMKNLVILARFSDLPATYTQAQFDNLFNQVGYNFDGAVGSVKDYYHEISYDQLTIQSTVSQWVTLPHGYAYYGAGNPDANPWEMVTDAINALAATGFDFSTVDGNNDGEVDGLTIIHSGRGEEANEGINSNYIWSHQSEIPEPIYKNGKKMKMYHTEPEVRGIDGLPATQGITRIGIIAHETGHFLGLPDLYDYGGDSKGAGQFCLMAGGNWNGPSGGEGIYPAHMNGWFKMLLGWATVTQISTRGTYSLPRIEDNNTAIYGLQPDTFPSNEYFIVENRQSVGFDLWIPGVTNGALIWHVDESKFGNGNNNDQTHYLVDLEEAGGVQHLAQNLNSGADEDYFRLGNNTVFSDTTTPNSLSYLGGSLGLMLRNISASGDTMSFDSEMTASATSPTSVAGVGRGVSSITWTWDNDVWAIQYKVYPSTGGTPMTVTSPTRTQISLSTNTAYGVRVSAVNAGGESGLTTTVTAYTLAATPVSQVVTSVGISSASIVWGVNQNPAATFFTLEASADSFATVTESSRTLRSTATLTALLPNTTWYFRTRAENGQGVFTSYAIAVSTLTYAAVPSGLTMTQASSASITIAWQRNSNPTDTQFEASFSSTNFITNISTPLPFSAASAVTQVNVSGLTAETTYYARVRARNRQGRLTGFTSISYLLPPSLTQSVNPSVQTNMVYGNANLTIPANSYSQTVTVTMQSPGAFPGDTSLVAALSGVNSGVEITTDKTLVPGKTLTLALSYTAAQAAGHNEAQFIIARYDPVHATWVPYPSTPNPAADQVTAKIDHLSVFQVMQASPAGSLSSAVIKVFPNPVRPSRGQTMKFTGLPAGASVKIYTFQGELVRALGADASGIAEWDGQNSSGQAAASEVYLALIKSGSDTKSLKVMLER